MLVLEAKIGEPIHVGEGDAAGTIEVVQVHGNKVRIGLTFPKRVLILRDEVRRRMAADAAKGAA